MDQGPQWPQPGTPGGQPQPDPYSSGSFPPEGGQAAAPTPAKGTPSWLVPALIAVIVVSVAGMGYFLVIDGDDDSSDDTAVQIDPDDPENPNPDEPSPDEPVDEEPEADPTRLTGTWEGTYECAGEIGGVTLTVDDYPHEEGVGAAFEYHPTDDNPDHPQAMFHMAGTYSDGSLSLEAGDWVDDHEPDGDGNKFDLAAELSDRPDTETIEGDIPDEGCEGFSVTRTSVEPWYVGAWQGAYHCPQGWTGATMVLQYAGQDRVDGWFQFYEDPERSTESIPTGSYFTTGWYQNRSLRLIETVWEEQPPGYDSVPWVSSDTAETNPNKIYGYIERCFLFNMSRIDIEDLPRNPMDDYEPPDEELVPEDEF